MTKTPSTSSHSQELSARIDVIQTKLRRLAAEDHARTLFGANGAHGHHYRQEITLNDVDLAKLEASFGVSFPDELRLFLTRVHSGGAGPGYGFSLLADTVPLARRSRAFPLDDEAARRIIHARLSRVDVELPDEEDDDDDDDWPPGSGFVPIAHHGCGVFDVLVTVGEQRGRAWCYDMTWCPHHDQDGVGLGFLDWYERWLDERLAKLSSR